MRDPGNGNIKSLIRAGAAVDNLGYTYSGNRLTSINDASANNAGVKSGASAYAYDGNGNMTSDGNRGATLTYNYLNLPKTVAVGGKTFTYDYDAGGTKHQYVADTLTVKYAGAFEYNENNIFKRLSIRDGQAIIRQDSIRFDYYLKDHLGNVRLVFDEKGDILQQTDYYPFGLSIDRNSPLTTPAARNSINRYLYNEKELQVGTGYLDYGARMYMTEIGRWSVVDPLAEQFPSWSPYNYGKNNPIRFKDIDGLAPFDITLLGANNSSVTVKTDLVDLTVNASGLGVDFGGNYTLSGNDVLQAAVDIGGVFDPTPTLDIVGASMSANSGDHLGAGASVLGAALPYVGDLAKTGKIAKGIDKISDAIDAAKGETKAFGAATDTESKTAKQAFNKAKDQNGIPRSQQFDKQYNVPDKNTGKALRQYDYTNSKGEKVSIRKDNPVTYPDGGKQGPHYNAGKSGRKLQQHHNYE